MIKGIRNLLPGARDQVALDASKTDDEPAPEITNSKVILRKQVLRAYLLTLGILVVFFIIIRFVTGNRAISGELEIENDRLDGKVTIEVASKSLDPEIMWRNHFEDKLIDSNSKMTAKLEVIEESFVKKEEELENATKQELAGMKEQLKFAKEELQDAISELKLAREQMTQNVISEDQPISAANISSRLIENERNIDRPKSSRNFIPATAYLRGIMLNGLKVSTSVSTQQSPIPVSIRITDRGNFPKDFEFDLKSCTVLGSSHGDLASERAEIRVEALVCRNYEKGQIITTRVVGMVLGDDGANGIKGKVIQTSNKHIQHAFMGGLLSGFSNVAKSQEQFTLTNVGALSNTPPLKDRIRDSGLSGLGNAGDKIADIYLKQAESMSPVLEIPGGTKVDILFTEGVYVGSYDVREKISRVRKSQKEGTDNE
jgi:hypothetical protein